MSTKSSSISHSPLYPLTSGFSLAVVGVLLAASSASAAQWVNNFSYGGSMSGDLYVPTTVKASPGIVVSLHYCGGTSSNAHGWFQSLADQYGFVIIAPQAGGNCFDATPARSGERDSISKMVQYVITQNHANAARVFASGASSGACMTNALLAAYPDVFAAGSVLAGVPAGAWTGGNAYGWTTPTNRTAQQWGDLVRNADSGFSGARPRVQLWHGTGDTTLTYSSNFPAEVAQWTNVLGVSDADSTKSTFQGSQDSWARTSYKNGAGTIVLETNVAQNAPHDLSGRGLWGDVVRFFGLDKDVSGTGGAGSGGASSVGSSGGAKATGGANATGGYGATGGSKSTGGSNAAGGSNATGGRSTASTSATGGVNTTGGSKSVGGSNTSGGSNNTGGANASGGSNGTGGSVLANGGNAAAGANATGGIYATGGTGAAGASSAAGATPTSSGGNTAATGGNSTTNTGEVTTPEGSCSCSVPGTQRPLGSLAALTAALLGIALRRRRG